MKTSDQILKERRQKAKTIRTEWTRSSIVSRVPRVRELLETASNQGVDATERVRESVSNAAHRWDQGYWDESERMMEKITDKIQEAGLDMDGEAIARALFAILDPDEDVIRRFARWYTFHRRIGLDS